MNWHAPWLQDYADLGHALRQDWAKGVGVVDGLNRLVDRLSPSLLGRPLRFVPQQALADGVGYEPFIHASSHIPTRENWHDLFNGLVWLRWPALKALMNDLHLAHWHGAPVPSPQVAACPSAPSPRRGVVRDALTVLDENGAWLQAPPALADALVRRDWHALFVQLRPLWAEARLHIFGHALLEKLLQPRKPICAHVLLAPDEAGVLAQIRALPARAHGPRPWHPLPVMGIPGWCDDNRQTDFYDDPDVFRP